MAYLLGFDPDFDAPPALSDEADGALLDLGGGNSVLFIGRTAAEFSADDFLIA